MFYLDIKQSSPSFRKLKMYRNVILSNAIVCTFFIFRTLYMMNETQVLVVYMYMFSRAAHLFVRVKYIWVILCSIYILRRALCTYRILCDYIHIVGGYGRLRMYYNNTSSDNALAIHTVKKLFMSKFIFFDIRRE